MKTYIAVMGQMASGKETICNLIQEELSRVRSNMIMPPFQFSRHRFSDPVNEALDVWGLPRERVNQQEISRILRECFGQDLIARTILKRVREDSADVVFIDGVRRLADSEILKNLSKVGFIHIHAPAELRYERLKKRNDRPGDADKLWENFLRENNAESEQKILEVAQSAPLQVDNSGTLDDLRLRVCEILQEVKLV